MENIKEQIKKYWDMRSETYDNSPGHSGLPEVWKKVLHETFGDKKLRILDVGTGTGFLAILLAELGHDVVGIDLSERMLERAKKKADEKGLDIEFMIADAENLPFDDGEFDAVINRHLLWTLPNPQKAINEWSRVIKRGGKVVAISPIDVDVDEIIKVPDVMEEVSPFVYAPACQLLAYYKAVELKRDVDKPRGLAKSVTVE